jgi:membrane protease YdiL (CAAX protease family)
MSTPDFIKRNPVLSCFSLAFVISWGLIVMLAGPGNMPIDAEQSQKLLPLLYTMMLIGPGAAGLLMTGMVHGKAGFKRLRAQLVLWRVGIRWYVYALLTAPVIASVILLILSRFSPEFDPGIFSSGENAGILLTGIFTGLMVGLFEEIGWSGFIIPQMRKRHSILTTGLIVGLLWGAWHFILFWEKDSFSGTLPLLIILGRLFAWLPPFRVFMVWILDRTGSLLMVILTHASLVFTTTVLVPMTLSGKNLLTWLILWGTVLWLLVLAIALIKGGIRSQKPTNRIEAAK